MRRDPSNRPETEVDVVFNYPSGRGDIATLEVTDRRSGFVLVEVDLTPTQLMRAISSSRTGQGIPAVLGPLSRIGKYHQHQTLDLSMSDGRSEWQGDNQLHALTVEATARADEFEASLPEVEGGWQRGGVQAHNNRYSITWRAYTTEAPR